MTTTLHHGTSIAIVTVDNAPQDQLSDIPSRILSIANEVRKISQLSIAILQEFQGAVKAILPMFSPEHQNQIYETFVEYHRMLMISQKFLTRSLISAARVRTTAELIASIDIKIIEELSETVVKLLEKFYQLNPILEGKLKDERAILICTGTAYFGSGFVKTSKVVIFSCSGVNHRCFCFGDSCSTCGTTCIRIESNDNDLKRNPKSIISA